MSIIDSFVKRRTKALAIERARFQLRQHLLGGLLLEDALAALEAVEGAHNVWVLTSEITQAWRARRCQVSCAREGPCLVCEREFKFGTVHWCLPPYYTRDFIPKQEDATT